MLTFSKWNEEEIEEKSHKKTHWIKSDSLELNRNLSAVRCSVISSSLKSVIIFRFSVVCFVNCLQNDNSFHPREWKKYSKLRHAKIKTRKIEEHTQLCLRTHFKQYANAVAASFYSHLLSFSNNWLEPFSSILFFVLKSTRFYKISLEACSVHFHLWQIEWNCSSFRFSDNQFRSHFDCFDGGRVENALIADIKSRRKTVFESSKWRRQIKMWHSTATATVEDEEDISENVVICFLSIFSLVSALNWWTIIKWKISPTKRSKTNSFDWIRRRQKK